MTEGRQVQRLFRVTPPLGTRGPTGHGGEYYTPTLRLALWHAFRQHTRGNVSGPPQSPTRSVEVSGSQTDPLTPWYNGRAGIIPFQYSPGLLEGIFQFNPWRDYSIGIQPGGDIGASSLGRRVMSGLAGGKGATPRLSAQDCELRHAIC